MERNRITMAQVVKNLKQDIQDVTGFPAWSVISLERVPDGWAGRVEVTEFHRVPEAQDLVGVYDVTIDEEGNLAGWDRIASHLKGQPFEFDGGGE